VSETETGAGRQAFGLGRPLSDVLDLGSIEDPTHSLFGGNDETPTTEALDAAMALGVRRRGILRLFIAESLVIGCIGGVWA